jgi:hypothetical protein
VAALRPGTRQLIVDLVEAGTEDDREPPAADVVWVTPAVERADPCEPLRRNPLSAPGRARPG